MEYKCKYFENSFFPNFGQYRSYKIHVYNALFKMDPNIFINLTHAVLLDESADDSKEHRSILFSFINLLILFYCMRVQVENKFISRLLYYHIIPGVVCPFTLKINLYQDYNTILYRGVQSISKQLSDFVSFGYVS